jgi:hypothetical protein
MSDGDAGDSAPPREVNPLVRRVSELLRQSGEAAQEDVPVLTEIADAAPPPAAPAQGTLDRGTLAADLEQALVARLAPELDRRLALLRAELEKELRRAVREAVGRALAAHEAKPPPE